MAGDEQENQTLNRDLNAKKAYKSKQPNEHQLRPSMDKDVTDETQALPHYGSTPPPPPEIDYEQTSRNVLAAIDEIGDRLTWTDDERARVVKIVRGKPASPPLLSQTVLIVIGAILGVLVTFVCYTSLRRSPCAVEEQDDAADDV